MLLGQCCFALNSTIHAATNRSPFSIIYGFDPSIPLDHAFSGLADNKVYGVENLVSARSNI